MPQRQPPNAHPADGIYFGLMSGTSMDGVDGVAARFEAGKPPVVLAEAFVVLERASAMPGSSILPEQTMILTRSLMQGSIEARWWDRLVAKLADHAHTFIFEQLAKLKAEQSE